MTDQDFREAPRFVRFDCPIETCGWSETFDDTPLQDGVLGGVFGFGIMESIDRNRREEKREKVLRVHFESHAVTDWIGEINRLKRELERERTAHACEGATR